MNMALVIITIMLAVFCLILGIEYFRSKTLDEIRQDVYKLFLKAEYEFKESHAGKQRMKWVVNKARGLLPTWAQMIITEEMFERLLQFWFDGIKDLLDDGKINNGTKPEVRR